MSNKTVFRKVSLDRLSSPEELDQRVTVTSPIGWLALIAVAILVIAGLIWGFFGNIANKAVGNGIIISSGGVTSIIHHINGQISDVAIKDGDYVEKGDVIARVEQTQLVTDINQLKEDLSVLQAIDPNDPELDSNKLNINMYGKVAEAVKDAGLAKVTLDLQKSSFLYKEEQAKNEIEQARLTYEETLENYNNTKYLYEQDAATKKEFSELERKLIISELDYKAKKSNLERITRTELIQAEENFHVLSKQLRDMLVLSQKDLEAKIKKLQVDLMTNSEIVSNVSGRILELRVKKGDLVQPGSVICNIAQKMEETDSLEAIVYVPVEQGKKVMPGMEVNIAPSTVKKEESGFMLGNVVSVSEYPSSAQGMMLTLGNQELVEKLSGDSAPIEVRVELAMDNSTVSGYKWSTPKGPDIMIDSGTFCVGEVKVEKKRPISMVMPFIKKILPF